MLQHKFNAQIVEKHRTTAKASRMTVYGGLDVGGHLCHLSNEEELKNMIKNFHLNAQFSGHLLYTSKTLLLC
jgi:hypothetical protein